MLDRFDVVGLVVSMCSLATVLFAYPFFWAERHALLPHTPVLPWMRCRVLPLRLCRALFLGEAAALLLLLGTLLFCEEPGTRQLLVRFCVAFNTCWVLFWVLADELIQTPQLTFFVCALLALLDPSRGMADLRLTFALMYAHGGLHKLNSRFSASGWRLFVSSFLARYSLSIPRLLLPPSPAALLPGPAIALAEALLGAALLLPEGPLLHAAVACLLAMHLAILLVLGPLGANSAHGVWPWNLACLLTLPACFWMRGPPLLHPLLPDLLGHPLAALVLAACLLAPLPAYWGAGYPQLSFMMYSANFPSPRLSAPSSAVSAALRSAAGVFRSHPMTLDYPRLTAAYHVTPIISLSGNLKLARYLSSRFNVPITLRYRHRPHAWTGDATKTIFLIEPDHPHQDQCDRN